MSLNHPFPNDGKSEHIEVRAELDEGCQQETMMKHSPSSRRRLTHRVLPATILVSLIWLFLYQHQCSGAPDRLPDLPLWPETDSEPVALEAHIMSKCPDARDCLHKLVVPAMVEVSDKVNFTLSYIGRIDNKSDEVSCMHGPGECLGNIIQLCAAHVYPDPKIYLGFTNCMTADYQDIPNRDLVEGCAMEHGMDFQKLNSCISDEGEGIELLRSSVERSRMNNVTKSCTIRLAGKVRCIRDGGEWYDCPGGSNVSDLVSDIKNLYKKQQ